MNRFYLRHRFAPSIEQLAKMATSSNLKGRLVKLDGRTGEGGGQVIRIAACLAALTGTPIKIEHVRGNRPGKNRGGTIKYTY
jgi:hypothetical protein